MYNLINDCLILARFILQCLEFDGIFEMKTEQLITGLTKLHLKIGKMQLFDRFWLKLCQSGETLDKHSYIILYKLSWIFPSSLKFLLTYQS